MKTIIAILLAIFACSVSPCNATEWTRTNGLTVRITTEQSILHPGDTLHVKVDIQNTSTNSTTIHRIPNSWEWLIVGNQEGKEFPSYPNAIPRLLPASPDDFVVLAPGDTHSGILSATLFETHSHSNAHWNPKYMKLVSGMRDYDLPPEPFIMHYQRLELVADYLKTNGEWRPFRDVFAAQQWIGEIRSLDLKGEATKGSQQGGGEERR